MMLGSRSFTWLLSLCLAFGLGRLLTTPLNLSNFQRINSANVVAYNGNNYQRSTAATATTNTPLATKHVLEAYQNVYQASGLFDCPKEMSFKDCLQHTLSQGQNATWPWWFHTLLRDTLDRKTGVHGFWHNLWTPDPPVKFCSLEKIGSTQWSKVFCLLNGPDRPPQGCKFPVRGTPFLNDTAPRFVFLRDPLERFLSAYMDKCTGFRRKENHCEPNEVFNTADGPSVMVQGLHEHQQRMFASYVDAFPLKWNLHFVPMSFMCDGLYREIQNYDFVGSMGRTFYQDLFRLSDRYGGKLKDAVTEVFQLEKHRNESFTGLKTRSPEHVKEFYTPETLKRVMSYLAIDYVALGLEVPEWAERMLAEEEAAAAMREKK